jgi:Flp pilus assembly pilin Flp
MISKHIVRSLKSQLARLICDEDGAELIESVLIIGMIVVVSMTAVSVFGDTIVQKWNAVVDGL